jgi:nitroreductase
VREVVPRNIPLMKDPMDLLLTRRSVGKIRADPVPREVVAEILVAAIQAPNHHLTEPWRFVVLTGAARRSVGQAHAAAVRRKRPDAGADVIAREAARLERAPIVIACIVTGDGADPVRAREDRDAVAAAIQNLLLAAHARGLATMWRTGEIVDEDEVRTILGLGPSDAIVAFVYLGVADVLPPPRERSPVGTFVEWRDT